MRTIAPVSGLTPGTPGSSRTTSGSFPRSSSEGAGGPFPAIEERHLRNATLIDQDRINAHPVAVVGVGAIGSHLTEILGKLGVRRFTLVDPDEVDTVNLGVQGFHEAEVGLAKTAAVRARLHAVNPRIEVARWTGAYRPGMIPGGSVVFACVDSIRVRRSLFRDFQERGWPVLFDGRMAAESLQVLTVDRSPGGIEAYEASLFPSHEAHRESCTARATVYCATLAAAFLCAQFKKWAMGQQPEPRLCFDLVTMDCFR